MAVNIVSIRVQLSGVRPLMFDRYAGDNSTQLPVSEKMYLTPERALVLPALNVYGMLASEDKSVVKQFFGKQAKTIALGIKSYTSIDPFEIPILDNDGPVVFNGFNDQIQRHYATARVRKAALSIPMPKERPVLSLPWRLDFTVQYQENRHCTLENLRQCFEYGGIVGLGTFRPFFGRYELSEWEY